MKENLNVKNENGSITVFVLVGLLFMVGILIISYGIVVNNSKIVKEQANIISQIYMPNNDINESYNEIYANLRKENKKTIPKTNKNDADTSIIELSNTYAGKITNYKIYGSSEGVGNVNLFPVDTSDFYVLSSSYVKIQEDGWMNINYDHTSGASRTWINFFTKYNENISTSSTYTAIVETQKIDNVGGITISDGRSEEQIAIYGSAIESPESNKIYCKTLESRSNFTSEKEGGYLCRSYIYIEPGYNASCKIRISLIKGTITADNWTGYTEYGQCIIPIRITDKDNNSKIYNIEINSPLYQNDCIDFKNGKIVRSNGTEESISLPELYTYEDYTKIEILTGNAPQKMSIEYTGYTLE